MPTALDKVNSPANLAELRNRETRRLRRARNCQCIADKGCPRIWFEFADQVARNHDLEAEVDRLLDRLAGVDAGLLRAMGVDKIPVLAPRVVPGGGRP